MKEQAQIQSVESPFNPNKAIESRYPAHSIPNDEHGEDSIGLALELESIKKMIGDRKKTKDNLSKMDKLKGYLGAGGGLGFANWTAALGVAGLATGGAPLVAGALTAMGLSGAALNVLHEVLLGNRRDDDDKLKQYIQWDEELKEVMDDKVEDELEDVWLDTLLDYIGENPQSNLIEFTSINEYAREKLGLEKTGEKVPIKVKEQLDQLVENFFQPKRDTLGLDQLVEMVEDLMGEKKKVDPEVLDAIERRAALIDDIFRALQAATQNDPVAIKKQTPNFMEIDNAGNRVTRAKLIDKIKQEVQPENGSGFSLEPKMVHTSSKSGKQSVVRQIIVKHDKLKDYSIRLKRGVGQSGLSATKFEVNLANAMNNFEPPLETGDAGEEYNELATDIIAQVRADIPDKRYKKLDRKGIKLSDLYSKAGVSSNEPKTDLISDDGEIRISVKKHPKAQAASAQGPEAAALFLAATREYLEDKEEFGLAGKYVTAAKIKKLFRFESDIAVLKGKSKEDADRIKKERAKLLDDILNAGMMDDALEIYLIKEAYLGSRKFGKDSPEAVPNYFLTWDDLLQNTSFIPAADFLKKAIKDTRVDLRGRGGSRGLSLRIDFEAK